MEAELLKRHIVHAETRGRSKTIRVAATDSYKEHGATEWFHYTNNTDAISSMYGGTAAQLRRKWGLAPKANVRDNLTTDQLNTIIQIEGRSLSSLRRATSRIRPTNFALSVTSPSVIVTCWMRRCH
jgi:hypothetical protein